MDHVLPLVILTLLLLTLPPTSCTINHNTYNTENNVNGPDLTFERTGGQNYPRSTIKLSQWPHVYCNGYTNIQGQEGSSKPGFTLRQLYVILSPGQTSSPLVTSDHHLNIPQQTCHILPHLDDSQKINSFTETSTIYSKVQHEKHGFKIFHPIIGSSCTSTHLTNTGFKQSITAGEHLFQSYFSNALIKLKLSASNIHAESATEQASYQSLLAFLHGLLPEKVFTKTKIHKASANLCNFEKESSLSCHCPKASEYFEPVWQSVMKGRFMYKDAYPDKDTVHSIFSDILIQNLSPLELLQVVMFHICDSVTVLCDRNNNCVNISSQHSESLNYLVSSFLKTVPRDATFQLFSQLYTFPFLQHLVKMIDTRGSTQQLHVHSSDSFFLYMILSSLGIWFEAPIPTASRLVLEIYQKNKGQPDEGALYFNMLHNGIEITDNLAICDGGLTEGLCSIERLREKVSRLEMAYRENC